MKPILIFNRERPLLAGVEHLLSKEIDLKLFSAPFIGGAEIANEILRLQPGVVIVDESLPADEFAKVLDLLKTFSELRVIVVSIRGNWLQVYDKKQVLIDHFDDFISAIRVSPIADDN